MGQFDSHLRCSLGAGAAFQLSGYTWDEKAVVKEGLGRVGRTVSVQGHGWVEGATPSAFASAVLAAQSGLAVSGQDVVIYGLGGSKEAEILAAWCADGGPHCSFRMADQAGGAALVKEFEFTIEATIGSVGDGGGSDPYKLEFTTGPGGLRQVTRSGEVGGPGAFGRCQANQAAAFLAEFPPNRWTRKIKIDANAGDNRSVYSFSAEEFAGQVVSASDRGGQMAVSVSRPESQRMTRTISFDLLVDVAGNAADVVDACRARAAAFGAILSESRDEQSMPEPRVRCAFVVLASGSGDGLLEFRQSVRVRKGGKIFKSFGVPGAGVAIYGSEDAPWVYDVSGSATGLGQYPRMPDPAWSNFDSAPEVGHEELSEREMRTTWSYRSLEPVERPLTAAKLLEFSRPGGGDVRFVN